MDGTALLETIISASGLPKSALERELARLLIDAQIQSDAVTIEQLRVVLENYLRDVLVEAKEAQA